MDLKHKQTQEIAFKSSSPIDLEDLVKQAGENKKPTIEGFIGMKRGDK